MTFENRAALVRLVDVNQRYRTGPDVVEVLQGVNLEIYEGDLVAIMGPSGSGKSTLMNIMGLLHRPTTGKYILKGREIANMDDDALAALRNLTIGFVFQAFHLLPRLSAWQNVGLPLTYRGVERKDIEHRARSMLEAVGLKDRVDHKPSELSGGQRQRVAIARALVGKPEILLADEPTGALDAATGESVMHLLRDLHAQRSMTTILITHDYAIATHCPRRFIIRHGKLNEQVSSTE